MGVKVNPAPNKPPLVSAGDDKEMTLPENSATLKPIASDPEGKPLTFKWEKESGPSATLAGASAASLSVSGLTEGSYVFVVTVTDEAGASVTDRISVKVNPLPNKPPVVNAGNDKTLMLPASQVSFTATAFRSGRRNFGHFMGKIKWSRGGHGRE